MSILVDTVDLDIDSASGVTPPKERLTPSKRKKIRLLSKKDWSVHLLNLIVNP
jgi:hypothetical protein